MGSAQGEKYGGVSAMIGRLFPWRVSFKSVLGVVVGTTGFQLSLAVMFRRANTPDLFIPWTAIDTVEEEKQFLMTCQHITLSHFTTGIWIYGKTGAAIQSAWLAARR